ncbi:MAG: hypothetical protein LVQ96_07710 [Thermoplasmatales archaeon]|nr:hypothetical protein [Thermoplasmatales archaeon]MCW6171040.1 hypothetical protein [Thermoplasmatales archaeon]
MRKALLLSLVIIVSVVFIATSFVVLSHSTGTPQQSTGVLNVIPDSAVGVVSNIQPSGLENPAKQLSVIVSLAYRNQGELNTVLSNLQNPSSPIYHHYLTQQQFISTFSPTVSEYDNYMAYFAEHGLLVKVYGDRVSLVLTGTVSQFESVFHTTISSFNNGEFYAPSSALYISANFGPISGIAGLSDQFKAKISPMFQGSGTSQTLYGADFQSAYQLNQLYAKYGYPTNETIATILWSGNNSAGQDVAPFVPSDISYYYEHNIPSNEPLPVAYGYPILGAPAPGPSAANDNTEADFESTLDLEMAGSAAPGAHIVEVYGPSATESDLDQAFAAVLNPNYNTSVDNALSHVVAISNSWGGTDTNDSTWMQYEEEAAARGITVLASSGDDGDTSSPAPSFPATMAYNDFGTLAVGGLSTELTGTASTNGSGTTGIQTESVWYNTPNSGDGSQGGVSSVFSEPSWQVNSSDANSVITGASSTTGVSSGRGTPDVAADGANMEIYITYSGSSGYQELWGTSIASPLTAGLIAVMDHSLGTPEGFIDPLIYKFGQEQYSGTFGRPAALYFVSNGSNGAFSAENGYSLAVGWGSINAFNFVNAQLNVSVTQASYPVDFSESGLPSGTTWSVTFNGNTQSSSGSTVSFSAANGTYSYSIGSVSGYTASPSSGSVTVNGAAQTIGITFAANSSPPPSTSGVFSQVNATSSNIYTYNLPEAEEFTVGSSSRTINFVTLYLSGSSGSVEFSIGTSLWSSNIVPETTVNVNSNQLWYNTSITPVNLSGSTDYYLSVEGSGSIQWGYTSSPSVDLNAIQDYWYSSPPSNGMPSGTPTNDNSYPDLYSIGYFTSTQPVVATFAVDFSESGLPSGTSWSVTFNGNTKSSTTSQLSFLVSNGTYSYSVGSVSGYSVSPSSGSVTVNGAAQTVDLSFSTQTSSHPNGIFAEVNATSSNIYTYNLPEAEEFTVGSSSQYVDFITLYLEGAGTIDVGIGTSLFSNNVVNVSSVSIDLPNGGFMNISIPTTELSGGADYYLNVVEPSGNTNVQWGYTMSPSVDNNALQDYWYSGTSLQSDNSYPDIFTIGYSGLSASSSSFAQYSPFLSMTAFFAIPRLL